MQEFYHRRLKSGIFDLPRIFGMTASPIKSKGTQPRESTLLLALLVFSL